MLSLSIHPVTEARLRRLAQEAGKDPAAYVSELLDRAATAQTSPSAASADDFDKARDEFFAADTRKLPSTALTWSRGDIYFDHN